MADTPNCPNCGKALVQFAPLSSTTMKAFCCDCAEAEPTLADVLAALKALHEICEGHAKLLLALTEGGFPVATKGIPVHIHEGEAIWPIAWADLSARSGKTPEASPGRTASGPGAV